MKIKLIVFTILVLLVSLDYGSSQTSAQNDSGSGGDAPDRCSDRWIESSDNWIFVSLDNQYTGEIDYENGDDFDSYVFTIEESGYLSIDFSSNFASLEDVNPIDIVEIYLDGFQCDPQINFVDPHFLGPNYITSKGLQIPILVPDPQTPRPLVLRIGLDQSFDYHFSLSLDPIVLSQNDSGANIDSLDGCNSDDIGDSALPDEFIFTLSDSNTLDLNGTFGWGLANHHGPDLFDCYRIGTLDSGYINIVYTPINNESGRAVITNGVTGDKFWVDTNIQITVPESQFYYMRIFGDNEWNSSYSYKISFDPGNIPQQNDGNSSGDADEISKIVNYQNVNYPQILFNSTISGSLGSDYHDKSRLSGDNQDVYRIPAIESGTMEIWVDLEPSTSGHSALQIELRPWNQTCNPSSVCNPILYATVNTTHPTAVFGERNYLSKEITYNITNYPNGFLFQVSVDKSRNNNPSNLYYQIELKLYGDSAEIDREIIIESSKIPSEDEIISTIELGASFAFMATFSILAIGSASMWVIKSQQLFQIKNYKDQFNSSTKIIVTKIFGPYASSYFVIGENFVRKEKIDPDLEKEFPVELLDQKFLLHPVRLALCKLLSDYRHITSSELRDKLGVSWADFSGHTKALKEKNYIHLEDKIIDGSVRQVISFELEGLQNYEKLIAIMIEFIDRSPLYHKYFDGSLKSSEDAN